MYSSILGSGEEAADHAHEILAQLSCHGHLAIEAEAETAVDRESPATPEGHREEDAGGNRS